MYHQQFLYERYVYCYAYVKYSENLTVNADVKYDFIVKDLNDDVELTTEQFAVSLDEDTIVIKLADSVNKDHKFAVELKNGRYIFDASSNNVNAFAQTNVLDAE